MIESESLVREHLLPQTSARHAGTQADFFLSLAASIPEVQGQLG